MVESSPERADSLTGLPPRIQGRESVQLRRASMHFRLWLPMEAALVGFESRSEVVQQRWSPHY